MDRLNQRIVIALRALASLEELSSKPEWSAVERDALLQRFEYTVEAVWKAAQRFLSEIEGLEVGSPKASVRASLQTGVLDESQARSGLVMIEDRNLTVHTYDERLAAEIAGRIPDHARLLRAWIQSLAGRTTRPS